MVQHTWVTLPEHDRYVINEDSVIAHARTQKILVHSTNQSGVRYVAIFNTKLHHYENKAVGVLMCEAFHGLPTEREATVLHKDGNLNNNAADNVMWATRWHAMAYHKEILHPDYKKTRFIIDITTGIIYANAYEAARATNALPSQIDYGRRYNDQFPSDTGLVFQQKTYPGGHVFRTP